MATENSAAQSKEVRRPWMWMALVGIVLSGCGLGTTSAERLERGQEAFSAGDYPAAIVDARRILQETPDNVAARLLLGRSALRIGDFATAEKELQRAAELGEDSVLAFTELNQARLFQGQAQAVVDSLSVDIASNDDELVEILHVRAQAFQSLDRADNASELYEQVTKLRATEARGFVGLASTAQMVDDLNGARQNLEIALSLEPDNIDVQQASGRLHLQSRAYSDAQAAFSRAIELAAAQEDAAAQFQSLLFLAEAQLGAGAVEAAQASADQLLTAAPDDLDARLLSSKIALFRSDLDYAQATLEGVLQEYPELPVAQAMLGAVQFRKGNLGEAELYLASALRSNPDDQIARVMLEDVRRRRGEADAGPKDYSAMLTGDGSLTDPDALGLAAASQLGLGDFESAAAFLEKRVSLDPENGSARLQLAAIHVEAGNLQEARTNLDAIEDPNVINSGAFAAVEAALLARSGATADALDFARNAQEEYPDSARLAETIGKLLVADSQIVQALEQFERAANAPDANAYSYLQLANAHLALGDSDNAEVVLDRYLSVDPGNPDVLTMRAEFEIAKGAVDTATGLLTAAIESAPEAIRPATLLSRLMLITGDAAAAQSILQRAIGSNPNNAELSELLGLALMEQANLTAALPHLQKAVDLEPDNLRYQVNLARAQAKGGDAERQAAENSKAGGQQQVAQAIAAADLASEAGELDKALEILRAARVQQPNAIPLYETEAATLAAAGRNADAANALDEALELDASPRLALRAYQIREQGSIDKPERSLVAYLLSQPSDDRVRAILAQSLQNQGLWAEAAREYEKIIQRSPNDLVATNNLAWAYFKAGDNRAESVARRAYQLESNNASIADTLGWILVKKGDAAAGIPFLRQAASRMNHPSVQFHLATGLEATGERDEAERILSALVASNQEFAERDDAQALLRTLTN